MILEIPEEEIPDDHQEILLFVGLKHQELVDKLCENMSKIQIDQCHAILFPPENSSEETSSSSSSSSSSSAAAAIVVIQAGVKGKQTRKKMSRWLSAKNTVLSLESRVMAAAKSATHAEVRPSLTQ